MSKSPKVAVGILVTILVIAIAGGVFLIVTRGPRKGTFCNPSLPIRSINGKTVALETRGSDGGQCEVPKTNLGMDTLGSDCKIRDPDGKVVATVKPGSGHGARGPDAC